MKSFFGEKLLTATIPRNIRLAEAPSHGKPVQLYDARSKGAEAYTALGLEILKRNGVASRKAKMKLVAAMSNGGDAAAPEAKKAPKFWPYNK